MFEDITPDSIKENILSEMKVDVDKREGSYTNDMIGPTALELWKVYDSMNASIPIFYIDETSGEYIDKKCAERGITRKAGSAAHVDLTFTGTDGTVIPAGTVFLTRDGLEYQTVKAATIASGAATVTANAAEVGEAYNVPAGSIANQYNSISGLTGITNASAATGGTDQESDKSLVDRYYNYLQKPATSGNTHHYEQWALEVNGVGGVKVTPLANGAGTVGILIVGQDKQPVGNEIVENCVAHIEASRPIGASVTVASASGFAINVEATITVESSTTKEKVRTKFTASLDTYLKGIAFIKYQVLYNQIAFLLLGINGVIDYSALTINSGTSNIAIEPNQVPVLGTVVMN
ncbi:baseplate J/gp47 family protein [Caproiciproducens sp.]|uniref:baseplate J/gp47 family protein n=1 Tax=Caproiciproducens sp. TaxID=1954376 RepID=UPI00289F74FF|nr:baseplate J/gp47 family protein [Caproiciproducens sp.]